MYPNNIKRIFTGLIIAVFALIATGAHAQTQTPAPTPTQVSYFGFFGGVSNPLGDFKKADYYNNKAGFAKKGLTYGLDGTWYFYKNLGLGGAITYQDNGELNQANADSLAAGYTRSFSADYSNITATKRYQTVNILLGPQYTFAKGKFLLDLRASAGILKVFSMPETSITLSGVTDQTATFYQKSTSSTVLAYSGTAALRYKLSDNVFLTFRGAYLYSQGPSVTNQDRTTNIGRIVTKQPFNTINTTIGLNFGL
ncbi:hypothetical protein [Mucilaginibacter sp. BT774]|uniref:hypothetical protein n=1 Tax=Mucilaginibacter sp. BT774 TaxID=3062276 RepID=UPI002675739E|nr:hypothetical protein [Mucilaginibacter sp. BT774]MDO3628127.1 hypothetical protein [Mucilaginibacter sp. BT774]